MHRRPPHSTFADLPGDVLRDVAGHMFRSAVDDQSHDVSGLDCNGRLQATLSEELNANKVLRSIHGCRSFAELCGALIDVEDVFPLYRQGCLTAAIRLLPKLGSGTQAPEVLWSQLRALLASVSPRHVGTGSEPIEPLLFAMIDTLKPARNLLSAFMGLEDVMAVMDPHATLSPKLEAALVRWIVDLTQHAEFESTPPGVLRDRLLAAAPVALQPRLCRLFDFFERHGTMRILPAAVPTAMAGQIQELDDAQAAGDPDHGLKLRELSRSWPGMTRFSPDCAAMYRAYFSRVDPEQQLWLIQNGRSPLTDPETVALVASRTGSFPAGGLLKTLSPDLVANLDKTTAGSCAELVRDIVQKAMHTPQRDDVLEQAITFENVHSLGLGPFFEQCITSAHEARQRALTIRLGLARVGCGERASDLVPTRALASAQMNAVLNDSRHSDLHVIETIVGLKVAWLDNKQRARLFERIAQLPPADSARCLAAAISQLAYARGVKDLPPTELILQACWNLPPEHRAKPVAALLDVLYNAYFQTCMPLAQGAVQLYDTLPTSMRPPYTRQRDEVMQGARNAAAGRA